MNYAPDCDDCPTPSVCKARNDCQVTRSIRHCHEKPSECKYGPRGGDPHACGRGDIEGCEYPEYQAMSAMNEPERNALADGLDDMRARWTKLITDMNFGDQFDGDIDMLEDAATALRAGEAGKQEKIEYAPDGYLLAEVSRLEDMSARGHLKLLLQQDGDIIISTNEQDSTGIISGTSVEFCTSGGRSRHTLEALRGLMAAMQADNRERPLAQPNEAPATGEFKLCDGCVTSTTCGREHKCFGVRRPPEQPGHTKGPLRDLAGK